MPTPAERLAREISNLSRRLTSVERTSAMNRRSVENGGVKIYGPDGSLRGVVGLQPDGTTALTTHNDPTPPMPSAPILEPIAGGLAVTWDGTFFGGLSLPKDFRAIEVHASVSAVYTPSENTLRARLAGSGTVSINLPADPYNVLFVAVTTGGSRSPASVLATETPSLVLTEADVAQLTEAANAAQIAADAAQAKADQAVIDAAAAAQKAEDAEAASAAVSGDILAAQNAADQAATDAAAALARAETAGDDAIAAQQAATDAQTAADAAATAASQAGTAASTADAAAAQAAADAAQALADAATAQDTADTAKTNAATAQTAANAAKTQADKGVADAAAAKTAADNAATAASNAATAASNANTKALEAAGIAAAKGKVYYGTAAPAADPNGLWIDQTGGANTPKRHNGTSWVAVTDKAATDAATAAAAAKTAADAAKTAADAAKTAADNAQGTANTAITNAATALTAANGKNKVFYLPSNTPPTGTLVNNDIWFKTDLGNAPFKRSGSSWVAATFGDGALASLNVGKLVSGEIAAGQKIIAGAANSTHAEMSDTGFRVYAADPVDGIPNEVIRLGTSTDDYFAIVGEGGVMKASIDGMGFGSFSALSMARWPEISEADHTGRGGNLLEMLDRRPRGLTAWGSDLGVYDSNTSAGRGIFDITAKLYKGRMYKICVRCRVNAQVANEALAEIQVRWTGSATYGDLYNTAGPAPTPDINSPIAGRYDASTARPEAQSVYFEKPFSHGPGNNEEYLNTRFLLCLSRPVGGTTLTMWGPQPDGIEMWIEDIGPYIVPTVTLNNGGGGVAAPPPAPQTQRFTRSWTCNWHQNWRGNNTFVDLPGAYQGRDPSGNNGNMKSYLGFSGVDNEGSGQTITSALSGAVVESVGVFLYANHWYSNSGGEPVIGMHGYVNPAGGYGGGHDWMVGGGWLPKPGGAWFNLDVVGPGRWQDGTWKGIMLGSPHPNADNLQHYGRFDAEGSAVLSITYRK